MEIIQKIESVKYTILDDLYAHFPDGYFLPSANIPRLEYRHICAKFRKIEDTINNINQQWWDKFFLELYLNYKISPRGLRNQKTCSFLGADLAAEWSTISEFCTQKWMEIIIKQRDTLFNSLSSKLTNLIDELRSYITPLPTSWYKKLKLNTKYQEDCLIKCKLQKIRRDFDDYNSNRIHCWKKPRRNTHPPKVNNHPNLHTPSGQENHTPVPLMECVPRPTTALLSCQGPSTKPYKPHRPPAPSRRPQPTPTPKEDHHRPPPPCQFLPPVHPKLPRV